MVGNVVEDIPVSEQVSGREGYWSREGFLALDNYHTRLKLIYGHK
jgi:hypothetical protein